MKEQKNPKIIFFDVRNVSLFSTKRIYIHTKESKQDLMKNPVSCIESEGCTNYSIIIQNWSNKDLEVFFMSERREQGRVITIIRQRFNQFWFRIITPCKLVYCCRTPQVSLFQIGFNILFQQPQSIRKISKKNLSTQKSSNAAGSTK